MRKSITVILAGAAVVLGGVRPVERHEAAEPGRGQCRTAEEEEASLLLLQGRETKGWAASRGKDGNIVVKGKAYREDPRYKAVLGEPAVERNDGRDRADHRAE